MRAALTGALRDLLARARRRGPLWLLGWAMIVTVAFGIVWIVVTGLLARAALDQARAELPQLRRALTTGRPDLARALVNRIEDQTAFADDLTSGPAWDVGANLPVLGSPLRTARIMTAQIRTIGTQVLPGVADFATQLAETAPPHDATVDLAPVERIEPTLGSAAAASARAEHRMADTPGSWLPFVSDARDALLHEMRQITGAVGGANSAVHLIVPMLGRDSPQRYFIGFMNEAESRGLGGLPGSFAIAVADHGHITFTHFGSDVELRGVRADVDLGPQYAARYSAAKSTTDFRDSTVSPDFSDAARIWASMWQNKTGERIDGAIALDPTTLGYLLAVTGPVEHSGTTLSAKNVVALTQSRQYKRFPSNSAEDKLRRKKFLVNLAKGLSGRLTKGGDPRKLIKALSRAAQQRRLMVWSAHPGLERQLVAVDWAGSLVPRSATFTGFTLNNASGSKLDYYLDRTLTYRRTDCGDGGTAVATLTVHSTAPRFGLPAYVTTRLDPAPAGAKVGDEALIVTYYGSPGARITQVRVDGRPIVVAQLPEDGLATAAVTVEVPAGGTVSVQVTVREPAAHGPPEVLRQPLARDMTVSAGTCR